MVTIKDRIEKLEKELIELKEILTRPAFLVGRIYEKTDTDSLYTFIDWNGEIRLLNITTSHMWKGTCKSYPLRDGAKTHKAVRVPYEVAMNTWTAGVEKFKLKF